MSLRKRLKDRIQEAMTMLPEYGQKDRERESRHLFEETAELVLSLYKFYERGKSDSWRITPYGYLYNAMKTKLDGVIEGTSKHPVVNDSVLYEDLLDLAVYAIMLAAKLELDVGTPGT